MAHDKTTRFAISGRGVRLGIRRHLCHQPHPVTDIAKESEIGPP
ncbi:hypothetical protein BN1184_AY_00270 [Pantoea ananatis]|nr:hypothetical protein BN1184_AY_00270 [Pantoea ananatis]